MIAHVSSMGIDLSELRKLGMQVAAHVPWSTVQLRSALPLYEAVTVKLADTLINRKLLTHQDAVCVVNFFNDELKNYCESVKQANYQNSVVFATLEIADGCWVRFGHAPLVLDIRTFEAVPLDELKSKQIVVSVAVSLAALVSSITRVADAV